MKKKYEKPILNASMEGTLEGVYAYGVMGANVSNLQSACHSSSNDGNDDIGGGDDMNFPCNPHYGQTIRIHFHLYVYWYTPRKKWHWMRCW